MTKWLLPKQIKTAGGSMYHNSCCLLDSEFSAVTPLCQYILFSSYSPLPVLEFSAATPLCQYYYSLIQFAALLWNKSLICHQPAVPEGSSVCICSIKQTVPPWNGGLVTLGIDKQLCGMNTQPRGSCHWAIVSKRLSWICIISFIIIGGSCHKHDFCRDKFCHDQHVFVATVVCVCCDKTCLLSWQKYACRDKSFVMTKWSLLQQTRFVMTKLLSQQMFVTTKHAFCHDKSMLNDVCHDEYLLWQKFCHDTKSFCHNKSFLATKDVLSQQKLYLWQLPCQQATVVDLHCIIYSQCVC